MMQNQIMRKIVAPLADVTRRVGAFVVRRVTISQHQEMVRKESVDVAYVRKDEVEKWKVNAIVGIVIGFILGFILG